MEKLLECQKKLLFNRSYDESTDTLYYKCSKNGQQRIIAITCDGVTDDDIKSNADYNALMSFKNQCCKDCMGCN